MAVVCFGIFAGAMALNAIQSTGEISSSGGMIWKAFQFGVPLLVGGLCLTGKRWAFMVAVIYGTVGLALDISTAVQSITQASDSTSFIVVILTTGILNFTLIVLGGKGVFADIKVKGSR